MDDDYGCDRGGPLRTEADRLLQAKYHQKERDRIKRNTLSRIVDVLDDVAPQHRPRPHTYAKNNIASTHHGVQISE